RCPVSRYSGPFKSRAGKLTCLFFHKFFGDRTAKLRFCIPEFVGPCSLTGCEIDPFALEGSGDRQAFIRNRIGCNKPSSSRQKSTSRCESCQLAKHFRT